MPTPDGLPLRLPPGAGERDKNQRNAFPGLAAGRSAALKPNPSGGLGRVLSGGTFEVVVHGSDGTVERPIVDLVFWVGVATPVNGEDYDFWYTENI